MQPASYSLNSAEWNWKLSGQLKWRCPSITQMIINFPGELYHIIYFEVMQTSTRVYCPQAHIAAPWTCYWLFVHKHVTWPNIVNLSKGNNVWLVIVGRVININLKTISVLFITRNIATSGNYQIIPDNLRCSASTDGASVHILNIKANHKQWLELTESYGSLGQDFFAFQEL